MKQLLVKARAENLDTVNDFVCGVLEAADCSTPLQMKIALAVEEAFVNIAHYAYDNNEGDVLVRTTVQDAVIVEFEDSGKPFNPLSNPDPNLKLGAEERDIGGLGVFMVKQIMDSVTYRYENNKNILTLKKYVEA